MKPAEAAVSEVEVFSAQMDVLGEGPLWSGAEAALYWLDIGSKRLFRRCVRDTASTSWTLPAYPGCLAGLTRESITIAMGAGIQRYDLATNAADLICAAPPMHPCVRFNDGKVDSRGRLWVTTMRNSFDLETSLLSAEATAGKLYRFDPTACAETVERHLGLPNTIAWSPDETRFYLADSARGQIYVYDYDITEGRIDNRRVFFEAAGLGLPDGSAIDVDGCLWNVRWDFGAVVRITPDGKADRTIKLPVSRPTNCVFGGPKLDTLFVTSARVGLTEEQLRRYPLSGSVFALRGAGQGMAIPAFGREFDAS